jgi:hypothetical protein
VGCGGTCLDSAADAEALDAAAEEAEGGEGVVDGAGAAVEVRDEGEALGFDEGGQGEEGVAGSGRDEGRPRRRGGRGAALDERAEEHEDLLALHEGHLPVSEVVRKRRRVRRREPVPQRARLLSGVEEQALPEQPEEMSHERVRHSGARRRQLVAIALLLAVVVVVAEWGHAEGDEISGIARGHEVQELRRAVEQGGVHERQDAPQHP